MRALLLALGLGLLFLAGGSSPASAVCVSGADVCGSTVIAEDNGFPPFCLIPCYAVTKTFDVFLAGNPSAPGVCAPGDNTYIYTLTRANGTGPFQPAITKFEQEVDVSQITGIGAIGGPDVSPSSTFTDALNGVVGWNFTAPTLSGTQSTDPLYLCSPLLPGGGTDTAVSVDGQASLDAPGTCVGPRVTPCDLDVDKTCCIPGSSMPGVDLCEGNVVRAVFEYTGDDCSASNNPQGGEAFCSGGPAGEPVSVTLTGKEPSYAGYSATPSSGVMIGDEITFSDLDGQTPNQTKLKLTGPGGVQTIQIHTSCSKALRCGDQFGGLRLVELETTLGGVDVCPDPDEEQDETQCVNPGAADGTNCTSRPSEIVFEYTGANCQVPLMNPQGGKATCSGSPNGVQPVSVIYTGKDPSKITVSPASMIDVGDTFRLTATGRDDLHSDSTLVIQDALGVVQNLKIHTSCSQTLRLGDVFGALKIVGMTTPTQGSIMLADPNEPIFQDSCDIPIAPPAPHCTQDVEELQLAYVGDFFAQGCTVSNTQSGKASCTGVADPGTPASVTITKDPGTVSADPDSGLNIADVTSLTSTDGKLGSSTEFTVSGPGGNQAIKIRTTCSKPLNIGDRFGSMVVVGMQRGDGDLDTDDGDDGFVGLGSPVEYQYKVTNNSTGNATNVTVEDDLFGTIGSGLVVPGNGGMITLFETKTVYATLTNTATVTGEVNGSECTPVEDSVLTTVEIPPLGSFDCKAAKPLDKLVLIWDGVGTVAIKAWKGAVGSTLLLSDTSVAPGDVVTITGYAGAPNDVTIEIFTAGGFTTKTGESTFHLSCSDPDMNGIEDCGKVQGDGKGVAGKVNTWTLEGMGGNGQDLDCTPGPIVLPGPGFCGLGFELVGVLPGLMWLHRRRRNRA